MGVSVDMNDVANFVGVVEAGGFNKAAVRRRRPRSTVSRSVARLEAALGLRLLERTTRSIRLTEAGRAYFERVSVAVRLMDSASEIAAEFKASPRGVVRLSAPTDVGSEVLPPLIAQFTRLYPEVQVSVSLSADAPSLVDHEFDLAIRGGPQLDSSMISRRLQTTSFKLFASPLYLMNRDPIRRPNQLTDHECLVFDRGPGSDRWQLETADGENTEITVTGRVLANDLTFLRRAALAGAGVVLLPELVARPLVDAGDLIEILANYSMRGVDLVLVYPSKEHLAPKVIVLRDHLLKHFPREDKPSTSGEMGSRIA
ncbi:MAG: LysR family transcriptional regulator [Myxococcota bacterium]